MEGRELCASPSSAECSYPVVSVYWISAYRREYLQRSVESFLRSTHYPNLELIVVDCSVGERGADVRRWLKDSEVLTKVIYRDGLYCGWNNANTGVEACSGHFIIHLEDDTIFAPETPMDWIEDAIRSLKRGEADAVNLFGQPKLPAFQGFMTSRRVRQQWGRWPCYPTDYETVTEAQAIGARRIQNIFLEKGFTCKEFDYVKVSLEAPSINLCKIKLMKGISYEDADKLVAQNVTTVRVRDGGYVSYKDYREMGGWRSCEFTLLNLPWDWLLLLLKGKIRRVASFFWGIIKKLNFRRSFA